MRRKPRVLILDRPRGRSPLLTQYYNFLMRRNGPLKIFLSSAMEELGPHYRVMGSDTLETPIDEIVARLPEDPDYIYLGFSKVESIQRNPGFVNKGGYGIITEVGDISAWGTVAGQLRGTKADLIVYRVHGPEHVDERITHYLARGSIPLANGRMYPNPLKDARLILMPWSIDLIDYSPRTWLRRDIDISFICSINDKFVYHDKRKEIRVVLRRMQKQHRFNIKIARKIFGGKYKELLQRTKMLIVDTSMRNIMTQKYLEGPAAGCMLLGEIPAPCRNDFVDRETIAETDYTDLEEKIKYYFNHQILMKRIAENGRKMVMEKYVLREHGQTVERAILEDWKGRRKK